MEKIQIKNHSLTAFSWVAGWLFSIGFLQLGFWKAVLAICIWPYYLGAAISMMIQG